MGNEQQNEGNLEQARGNIKEGVGDAIGNDQMKREGQVDQAKGQLRQSRETFPAASPLPEAAPCPRRRANGYPSISDSPRTSPLLPLFPLRFRRLKEALLSPEGARPSTHGEKAGRRKERGAQASALLPASVIGGVSGRGLGCSS